MTDVQVAGLTEFLAAHPPFDSLDRYGLGTLAEAARVDTFDAGTVVVDAFAAPTVEVFVVRSGQVDLWHHADRVNEPAEVRLGPGELFGFSAMLTEQPSGPLAVAVVTSEVVRLPGSVVLPAFASPRGARFLAGEVAAATRRPDGPPSYSLVDDLILTTPLVVEPQVHVADAARQMSEHGQGYAVVRTPEGWSLLTDAVLRERVVGQGRGGHTPVGVVAEPDPPVVTLGDSAAEALILLLDREAEHVLVCDRSGELRGVIAVRDFAISPTTAGVSLDERLRRAATADELVDRARRLPATVAELLVRGLAADKVLAVYSAMLDTTVRRGLQLSFAAHPELDIDAFTWLSLGSNGRREAVPSSDLDSAAAFDDRVGAEEIQAYRTVFAELDALVTRAGVSRDDHGATASKALFARTNGDWRTAAREWLATPEQNKGAIMTSLLVDGRPVLGEPGLTAVSRVFSDLRQHRGTMRLLLQESLARRAKLRSVRDVLARRPDTFDIKTYALQPIVNIARWAALTVGSAALPTTERLRAAGGSEMLPREQAGTLAEVFTVLQRLRLDVQLEQLDRGEAPSDVLAMSRLSALDRSVIAQAVREISAIQRRMDNVSVYVPLDAWTSPEAR